MSYEKQTWVTGDIITAEKLNHMEDGIAGAESGGTSLTNPIVKITLTGDSPIRVYDLYHIANNELENKLVMSAESETVDALAFYFMGDEEGYMVAPQLEGTSSVTQSNLVNCTYSYGEIYVTDPTADASITLTYVTGGN